MVFLCDLGEIYIGPSKQKYSLSDSLPVVGFEASVSNLSLPDGEYRKGVECRGSRLTSVFK